SAGCGSAGKFDLRSIVPLGHDELARSTIAAVRAQRFDEVHATIAPRLAELPGLDDSLRKAGTFLPAGDIDSLVLVGANILRMSAVTRSRLTYELHTARGWGAVDVVVAEELGRRYIEGFRTYPLSGSLEEINAFSWRTVQPAHVLVLLLFAACF